MRLSGFAFLAFLAVGGRVDCATPAVPAEAPSAKSLPEVPSPSIQELIADLSSVQYNVRELATLKLWAIGEPALAELKNIAAGDDPEAAFRATGLVRNIEHFITPDTDPELIQQVESYKKANREGKGEIMSKIAQKKGWHQILRLYASEDDPLVREDLRDHAYIAAVVGAREKIVAGKDDEALRFLELAPRDSRSLIALACYHRAAGTLEEERRKAIDGPADWRAALARAAGDTRTAAEAARQAGDRTLAAGMDLFNGEFLPWLDLKMESEEDSSKKLYMEVVGGRWDESRKQRGSVALSRLVSEMTDSRDEDTRDGAATLLFLLGQHASAEAYISKQPLIKRVDHYTSLERFNDAWAAFGLNPSDPDAKGWVERHFSIYLNQKRHDEDQAREASTLAQEEVLRLATLLSQLGMSDELVSLYEKPVLAMAESDPEEFTAFVSALFYSERNPSGTSVLAQKIGTKWAGKDDGRWRQLINLAFNEDEVAIQWWEWMSVLEPESSPADRFEGLLGLFNSIPDPKRTRNHWLELALKALEEAAPGQKAQYVKRIGHVSGFSRGVTDIGTYLRLADHQDPEEREGSLQSDAMRRFVTEGLALQGRWKDIADIYEKISMDENGNVRYPNRPDYHAFFAASLRKLGREDDAKIQDTWAEKLALADPRASVNISAAYAFGGDEERSNLWMARYNLEAPAEAERYADLFEDYSTHLLENGKWREAAALAEAMALIADSRERTPNFAGYMVIRMNAALPHALSLLGTDPARAGQILSDIHGYFPGTGQLADHFFPSLRKAGLMKEHERLFEDSWRITSDLTKRYPSSGQLLNGSAWLASRAVARLPEAEAFSTKALELNPDEAAYLDTMAEVQFAKRDRKAAVKWSSQAVNFAPLEPMIRQQYERFQSKPFPGN